MNPDNLRFSKEHEWARVDGDMAVIGITKFAAGQLGDVVYVDLPAAGTDIKQFSKFGEIESVKAVSDLFSPLGGEILEVNQDATDNPEIVNSDTYGDGWLIKLKLNDLTQLDQLMDAAAYEALIAEES